MKIEYSGPFKIRTVEPHQWNSENKFVVDMTDPALVVELLTHPPGDFAISETDPLLKLIDNPDQVGVMVLAGIINPSGLAALGPAGVKTLASSVGTSEKQIKLWVKQASLPAEPTEQGD